MNVKPLPIRLHPNVDLFSFQSLTNPVNINTTQSLQLQMFNWTQLQKWSITLVFQFIGLQHTSAA